MKTSRKIFFSMSTILILAAAAMVIFTLGVPGKRSYKPQPGGGEGGVIIISDGRFANIDPREPKIPVEIPVLQLGQQSVDIKYSKLKEKISRAFPNKSKRYELESWPAEIRSNRIMEDPKITLDGADNSVITWAEREGAGSYIYAQSINNKGRKQWIRNRIICDNARGRGQRGWPKIISGGDYTFIAWEDNAQTDLYAQKLNYRGIAQWEANGVPVCNEQHFQSCIDMVPDGEGGVISCWSDNRDRYTPNVYMQRINTSGTAEWMVNGITPQAGLYDSNSGHVIADGEGGTIIVWQEKMDEGNILPFNYHIFAQRINSDGNALWGETELSDRIGGAPQIISDGIGWAIIAWIDTDAENHNSRYIRIQRIDREGNFLWPQNGISIGEVQFSSFRIISDGSNGAIVVWQFNGTMYAQRIDERGRLVWGEPKVLGNIYWQDYFKVISDNSGGAVIAWTDTINKGDSILETDIMKNLCVQRIDTDGRKLWQENGLIIGRVTLRKHEPWELCGYGFDIAGYNGGAILTWQDKKDGNYSILAQKINADGTI